MSNLGIKQIAESIIRGAPAITFPLQNHDGWVSDTNGHHVLDIRGWGHFQYADGGADKGAEIQDVFGDWVVETLNRSYQNELACLPHPLEGRGKQESHE